MRNQVAHLLAFLAVLFVVAPLRGDDAAGAAVVDAPVREAARDEVLELERPAQRRRSRPLVFLARDVVSFYVTGRKTRRDQGSDAESRLASLVLWRRWP